MLKNCYHLCTAALKDKLLCYDEADYTAIWNALAVCVLMSEVKLFCLCIMSNHIHILLSGTPAEIARYFGVFKQKAGMYLKERYNCNTARLLSYELFPVPDRKAFCQEVAYILRNPYKAGMSSPFSYRWSTYNIYFNPYPKSGKSKTEYPIKVLRKMLRTRYSLPDSIKIVDGILAPSCFVDVPFVERMFEDSSVMFFNLIKNWTIEDAVNASHGQSVPDPYSDEEVFMGIKKICQELFLVSSPDRLDKRALARLVRQVRTRFGCPKSQLMRLLPIDDYLLDRIL